MAFGAFPLLQKPVPGSEAYTSCQTFGPRPPPLTLLFPRLPFMRKAGIGTPNTGIRADAPTDHQYTDIKARVNAATQRQCRERNCPAALALQCNTAPALLC